MRFDPTHTSQDTDTILNGMVLQETPTGAPLTAMLRPLFFRHPIRVPKADLTDAQHQRVVAYEEERAKRHEVDGLKSLRNNVDKLNAEGFFSDALTHEWWEKFMDKQDKLDFPSTAGTT